VTFVHRQPNFSTIFLHRRMAYRDSASLCQNFGEKIKGILGGGAS